MKLAILQLGRIVLVACLLGLWPNCAWALQTHPSPEGLYAHLLAHLFFIATLGVFIYWLQSTQLAKERGWRLIQLSCLLFILWNLDTFTVHWLEHTMAGDMFVTTGLDWSKRLALTAGWRSWIYYFGKFDHLFCVPAIIFLLRGLRQLHRQAAVAQLSSHD